MLLPSFAWKKSSSVKYQPNPPAPLVCRFYWLRQDISGAQIQGGRLVWVWSGFFCLNINKNKNGGHKVALWLFILHLLYICLLPTFYQEGKRQQRGAEDFVLAPMRETRIFFISNDTYSQWILFLIIELYTEQREGDFYNQCYCAVMKGFHHETSPEPASSSHPPHSSL